MPRRSYEEYEIDEVVDDSISRRKKRSGSEVARYCGREATALRLFGVVFPKHSYPIDASSFTQIDSQRWSLDMTIFVGKSYDQVTEMCIFLINQFSLPPGKALTVYVQSPGSQFQFCGAVTCACPSAMISLLWPKPGGAGAGGDTQMQITSSSATPQLSLSAKIGVAAEDCATLPALNLGQYLQVERLAFKVGENLFRFMQSYCTSQGDSLVVPLNILDRWFKRFRDRASKDPSYLDQYV